MTDEDEVDDGDNLDDAEFGGVVAEGVAIEGPPPIACGGPMGPTGSDEGLMGVPGAELHRSCGDTAESNISLFQVDDDEELVDGAATEFTEVLPPRYPGAFAISDPRPTTMLLFTTAEAGA